MEIKKIVVGPLETNCYILIKDKKCLIIDPGADYDYIVSSVENNQVVGLVVTHYHFDHVGALDKIKNNYNTFVYDKNNLKKGLNAIDNFNFEVIYTPGHSSDLITLYFKEQQVMFVGDFIFKENIGRCDLATGDFAIMLKSINKIKKYNDKIIIYPGHGESTTLAYEKANNQYF